jgi:hypothetical protein
MDRPGDRPATPRWYHRGTVPGYCGRPSSSFTQLIFSLAGRARSAQTRCGHRIPPATPAAVTFFRRQNRRVPHVLL